MDARPVLIPILSSVVCFPIVAFAVICALRYRAQRVRRKERLARLRGAAGTRTGRLEGLGRFGERPSFFSHDSSSGDASCWRPPESGDDCRRSSRPGASSSSSSGGYHFVDEITAVRPPGRKKSVSSSAGTAGSRRGSRVTFGVTAAAATVLEVPVMSEPRPGSPRSAPSSSPRSSSPQSPTHARSGSVSFVIEPSVVNGYDADADDEDDTDSPKCGTKDAASTILSVSSSPPTLASSFVEVVQILLREHTIHLALLSSAGQSFNIKVAKLSVSSVAIMM
ncbi:hypothetical protein HPB50_006641 [Hyalomma asiaticum]|uniref:Uncharacterized protein n=1 Tax=Hyalomma asiaticum TaxID=266040 RepID=A0ACB7STM1_HYAAI|nr:hypothetical protein HPB50_006641 [Hyalomma asiaticum]